jgi:lysozyme
MNDRTVIIDDLVRDEDLRLHPYWDCGHSSKLVCPQCQKGLLTIGIGRNLSEVGLHDKAEAFHLCHTDLDVVDGALDHFFPGWRLLDEARQRVVVNMCFNMGIDRLKQFRNMWAAIEAKNFGRAADEMKSSAWYGQVKVRAERLERIMRGAA